MSKNQMHFVELLKVILQSHAEVLQQFCSLLPSSKLIEVIDHAVEKPLKMELKFSSLLKENLVPGNPSPHSPYDWLQTQVNGFDLPVELTFYLWSYEPYRKLIESSIPLDATLQLSHSQRLHIANELIELQRQWVRHLNFPPSAIADLQSDLNQGELRLKALLLGEKRLGLISPQGEE